MSLHKQHGYFKGGLVIAFRNLDTIGLCNSFNAVFFTVERSKNDLFGPCANAVKGIVNNRILYFDKLTESIGVYKVINRVSARFIKEFICISRKIRGEHLKSLFVVAFCKKIRVIYL